MKFKQIRKIIVLTDWGAKAKKSKCLNRDFYDSMITENGVYFRIIKFKQIRKIIVLTDGGSAYKQIKMSKR